MSTSPNLGIKWCLILGVFGFLAGFVGPMILAPDANQGPLLGIFITGPGGAFAGLVLWVISNRLKWPLALQWKAVYFACAALLSAVVFIALKPKPQWVGWVYDVEFVGCQPIVSRVDAVLADWQKRISVAAWLPARTGWEDEVRRIFREHPGSVVEVKIREEKVVKKEKEQYLLFQITGRRAQNSFFFLPKPCAKVHIGSSEKFFVESGSMHYQPVKNLPWPPQNPADLLVLAHLRPVPENLRDK